MPENERADTSVLTTLFGHNLWANLNAMTGWKYMREMGEFHEFPRPADGAKHRSLR